MYGIALSVTACLRAGTRADVAWSLDPELTPEFDPNDAVALTPGGGRLGSLFDGALDSRLIEEAGTGASVARVIPISIGPLEAEPLRVEIGTVIRVMLAPAATLPEGLWPSLLDREPVGLTNELQHRMVTASRLATGSGPSSPAVDHADDSVTTWFAPRTTLVVTGGGPMAEAVVAAGEFVGWKVEHAPGTEAAIALATSLSPIDGIVVTGHDTEAVGRTLQAALGSRAGYLGSIGPAALQDARRDWLAYRNVAGTDRLHAPAGIDIGARAPAEVAISVVAEMIAALSD